VESVSKKKKPPGAVAHCGRILPKIRITIIFYKSTHPYSRKRALHFRRKAKSFILRSNASRREEFPALHVDLRHANQHPGGGPWLTAIKILGKN